MEPYRLERRHLGILVDRLSDLDCLCLGNHSFRLSLWKVAAQPQRLLSRRQKPSMVGHLFFHRGHRNKHSHLHRLPGHFLWFQSDFPATHLRLPPGKNHREFHFCPGVLSPRAVYFLSASERPFRCTIQEFFGSSILAYPSFV